MQNRMPEKNANGLGLWLIHEPVEPSPRIGARLRGYLAATEQELIAGSEDVFLDAGRSVRRWLAPALAEDDEPYEELACCSACFCSSSAW